MKEIELYKTPVTTRMNKYHMKVFASTSFFPVPPPTRNKLQFSAVFAHKSFFHSTIQSPIAKFQPLNSYIILIFLNSVREKQKPDVLLSFVKNNARASLNFILRLDENTVTKTHRKLNFLACIYQNEFYFLLIVFFLRMSNQFMF